MRLILLSVAFLQFLKLHHSANPDKKWYFSCTEEAENMEKEFPRLLNIERGKLARGERTYRVKPGEYAKYEPAANMEESKWLHENAYTAKFAMELHINSNGTYNLHRSLKKNLIIYRLSSRVLRNATSCKNAWMDYVDSNDRQKMSMSSLRKSREILYLNEIRTETFKSISNYTDIGCIQLANDDKDIMTLCAHTQLRKIKEQYKIGTPCSSCPDNMWCNDLMLCSSGPKPVTTMPSSTSSTIQSSTTQRTTTSTLVITTPLPTTPSPTTPSPTTSTPSTTLSATTQTRRTTQDLISTTTTAEDFIIGIFTNGTNQTTEFNEKVTESVSSSQKTTVSTPSTSELPIYIEPEYDYQEYEYVEVPEELITKTTLEARSTSTPKPSTKKVTSRKLRPPPPITKRKPAPTPPPPEPKPSEMRSKSAKNYIIVFILVLVLAIIVFIILHCMRMRRA